MIIKEKLSVDILNFLPKELLAEAPKPEIYWVETEAGFNGRYIPRIHSFYQDGVKVKRGLIQINIAKDNENFKSTLAHEWRHHWQWYNWDNSTFTKDYVSFDSLLFGIDSESYEEYVEVYARYFLLNPCEMDALKFQLKYAPANNPIEGFMHIKSYYPKLINKLNRQLEGIYENSNNIIPK